MCIVEKTKIYTQTVISGNVRELLKNPNRRDELFTTENCLTELTEAEYERLMKDQEERVKRVKELLVDMMDDYLMKRR